MGCGGLSFLDCAAAEPLQAGPTPEAVLDARIQGLEPFWHVHVVGYAPAFHGGWNRGAEQPPGSASPAVHSAAWHDHDAAQAAVSSHTRVSRARRAGPAAKP